MPSSSMIATWTLRVGVPTAPVCVSWCSGRKTVVIGDISVCPKSSAKSQPKASIARRRSASGIGAMA